jgi:hypothetical protein
MVSHFLFEAEFWISSLSARLFIGETPCVPRPFSPLIFKIFAINESCQTVPGERRCVIFEQYRTLWRLLYFPNIHLPYILDEFHDT